MYSDVKQYRHLFFDLDRTLWDFDRNSVETLNEMVISHKLLKMGVDSVEEFIHHYQEINHECWALYRTGAMEKSELRTARFERTLLHFGISDDALTEQLAGLYIERSPQKTHLIDGTMEVLTALTKQGYRLHIITNGFEEVQHVKMNKSGLAPFFEWVLTSEMVGVRKPHPRVFEEAVARAGCKKDEAIMIGDDLEADILGARDFGMDQVFFNPNKQVHPHEVTFDIDNLLQLKEIFR